MINRKKKIYCFKNKIKTVHSSDKEFNKLYDNAFSRKDVVITNNLKDLKQCKKIVISINFEINKKKIYQNLQKFI